MERAAIAAFVLFRGVRTRQADHREPKLTTGPEVLRGAVVDPPGVRWSRHFSGCTQRLPPGYSHGTGDRGKHG